MNIQKIAEDEEKTEANWSEEKCPKCFATLLQDNIGNKWCSFIYCNYHNWKNNNDPENTL
jgi:acetyl-CoA carboxylase beta subunit